MAILLGGREAYALFLESDWWKAMSFERRRMSGFKCERCGKEAQCQAHHKLYRDHWFDTKLEDLECICRECHEKEHQPERLDGRPEVPYRNRHELEVARSDGRLSRAQFLDMARMFPIVRKKKSRIQRWKKFKAKRAAGMRKMGPVTAKGNHVKIRHRMNWVQRGNSSN